MVFMGKTQEGARTLASYGIQKEATLDLVFSR